MMNKIKKVSVFIILFFLFPLTSLAWWTQIHPMISGLSADRFYKIMQATNFPSYQHSRYRQDFIHSATDPDHNKNELTHGRAKSRANRAFDWAIRRYKTGEYRLSMENLAHCFHYVQDFGDPSKSVDDFFHKSRGRYVRKMAEDLLKSGRVTTAKDWPFIVGEYSKNMARLNRDQTMQYMKNKRRIISGTMRNLFESYKNDSRTLANSMYWEVLKSIALTVATQNHLLDIYYEKIKNAPVHDPGPIITPTPRPRNDYESQATPRPSY